MLSTKDLSIGYNGNSLLDGINLTFEMGKISVLIGPNGCGKSTLLKTLSGNIMPINGEVILDNVSLCQTLSGLGKLQLCQSIVSRRNSLQYLML